MRVCVCMCHLDSRNRVSGLADPGDIGFHCFTFPELFLISCYSFSLLLEVWTKAREALYTFR